VVKTGGDRRQGKSKIGGFLLGDEREKNWIVFDPRSMSAREAWDNVFVF